MSSRQFVADAVVKTPYRPAPKPIVCLSCTWRGMFKLPFCPACGRATLVDQGSIIPDRDLGGGKEAMP